MAPAYVGSLVLRVPAAMVPTVWNASPRAVYFASATPCIIALVAFCTWLAAQPRTNGGITWASRLGPLMLCILNPIFVVALLGGHPEEILGAVLCVAAVVTATRGRAGWAGFLIGLAVVNKSWALVAVPVVLVSLPAGRRRAALIAAATVAVVMIPATALHGGGITDGSVGTGIGTIFNPPQLLWWFGSHSWIAGHARFLIIAVAICCAAAWWPRARSASARSSDPLLLLAMVLLLRAALDPWNNLYYHVPFLLALIAYEVRSGRMASLGFIYTFVVLIVVPIGGLPHMSHDLRAAVYACVVLPTFAALAWRLYAPWELREVARSKASLVRSRFRGTGARNSQLFARES